MAHRGISSAIPIHYTEWILKTSILTNFTVVLVAEAGYTPCLRLYLQIKTNDFKTSKTHTLRSIQNMQNDVQFFLNPNLDQNLQPYDSILPWLNLLQFLKWWARFMFVKFESEPQFIYWEKCWSDPTITAVRWSLLSFNGLP